MEPSWGAFRLYEGCYLSMSRNPDVRALRDFSQQFLEYPDARAVSRHMRMHREQEKATFVVGTFELPEEDVIHIRRCGVRAQAGEAVHVEIDCVVTDPLYRQFDDAGLLAFFQKFV